MKFIGIFRKVFFAILLLLFPLVAVLAQSAKIKKMEAEADNHFKYDRNHEALELYLQLDSLRPDDPKTIARIGICYLYHIKSKALPYLKRATELKYKEDHVDYYLARAYHLSHLFNEAEPLYKSSRSSLKSKEVKQDVELFIKNCQDGKELIKNPVHVKIENLGSQINTEHSEFAPIISADESTLIFTSQRPTLDKKKNWVLTDDIFISHKENGVWGKAENMGSPINTPGSDASVAFSMDGGELFIYKSDSLNPNGGQIYISKKDGDKWGAPAKMNTNINSPNSWDPSISMSPNEEFIFIASDRPGGFGGTDIYVSKKMQDGQWGKPKNLGPVINTKYDEDAPFIHPDGKTLYFSSKGHPSLGGFDIFTSTYLAVNDSVTTPENVGYPMNTADDEIFFIWSVDGTRGYFSSAREDTYGRSDIYMVTRPNVDINLILLSGNVSTTDNKKVAASIIITDNSTNKIVGVYDSTKFKDKFALSLEPGKNYGIAVEAKNYLTYSENLYIPVNGFHDIKKDIKLTPLDQGGLIVLKNVLFEPGKAELKDESSPELERYLNLVKENPSLLVEIAGHAFDLEDHKSNLELSEKRAEAVRQFLIKKGANPNNIKGVGYGDRFKVSDDDNSANTRSEFIIRQAIAKEDKFEHRQGYYYENEKKAMSESKTQVENAISTKLKEKTDYLVKKDEDIYFGVNNSKSLKDFKVNEEVREKVKQGKLQPVMVNGQVSDASTGKKIYSNIIITDNSGKKISETKTSEDGKFSIELYNTKEKKYTVTVQSEGYNYSSKDITAPANGTVKKDIAANFTLSNLEVGKSFIVRNIYFDHNAATIKQESYKELKKLETLLKKNKSIKVEISGHTDSKGSDDYNKTLSQRRAESVEKYLTGKGISKGRIIAKGYGEEKPMASNDDEAEGRELNRRIEFQILER